MSALETLDMGASIVIVASLFSVASLFFFFAFRRRDLAFSWFVFLVGLLILTGGTTRIVDIFELATKVDHDAWHVATKFITAIIAIVTGISFWRFFPQLMEMPSHEKLHQMLEVENGLRLMAEYIPGFIMARDVDNRIYFVNKQAQDYFGMSHDEFSRVMGTSLSKTIVHSEDYDRFMDSWRESRAMHHVWQGEARLMRFDGQYHWFAIKTIPFINFRGDCERWFTSMTDIHDTKTHQEELDRKNRELSYERDRAEAANRAKSLFLANMSHEIRTPLGAILGFSNLLMAPDAVTPSDRQRYMSAIQRNGDQLLQLIDDILDLSKIEAGKIEYDYTEVTMKDFLRDMCLSFKAKSDERKLVFSFTFLSPIPLVCRVDPTRLRQAVCNMLSNAIKFTENGLVEFNVGYTGGRLQFVVADTGIGIAPDKIEHLFQTFAQADSSITRRFGGSGLGLTLARRLARGMNGDLQLVRSEVGVGSVFELFVKVQSASKEMFSSLDGGGVFVGRDHEKHFDGWKILVAEDSEDNQLLIRKVLTAAGGTVEIVDNGVDAVTYALKGDFDLIFMDIQMPRMDGLAATEIIRKEGYKKPIVALSAHAMPEEIRRSIEAGCDDHLTKPINFTRLHKLAKDLENSRRG